MKPKQPDSFSPEDFITGDPRKGLPEQQDETPNTSGINSFGGSLAKPHIPSPLPGGKGSSVPAGAHRFDPSQPIEQMSDEDIQRAQELSEFPDLLEEEEQHPTATEKRSLEKTGESVAHNELSTERITEERVQQETAKIRNKHYGSPDRPVDILKEIIMKGEYKETFSLYGYKWTMRALDESDLLNAADQVRDDTDTTVGRLTAFAFSQVVYAIEAIDDIPIYEFFPEIQAKDYRSKIDYIIAVKAALKAYMLAFPHILIDSLFTKFKEITAKRDSSLEELKNS